MDARTLPDEANEQHLRCERHDESGPDYECKNGIFLNISALILHCDKKEAVEWPLKVRSHYIAKVDDVAGQHNCLASPVSDVAEFSHQLLHFKAHENELDMDLQFDH